MELKKVSKEDELYKGKLTGLQTVVDALDKQVRVAEGTMNAAKNAMERTCSGQRRSDKLRKQQRRIKLATG